MRFLKKLPAYKDVQPYRFHDFPNLSEEQKTNCEYEEVEGVVTQNLRDVKESCHFGEEGFEFVKAPTRCVLSAEVFENDGIENNILEHYLQETIGLVKDRLNAQSASIIDWRVTLQLLQYLIIH